MMRPVNLPTPQFVLDTTGMSLGTDGHNTSVMPTEGQLRSASRGGRVQEVRKLIAAGANIDERDSSGCTPLYIAALNGQAAVVRVLLDGGADKEAMSDHCVSPLFVASMKHHEAVIKILMDAGAVPQ
ncbi:ankyrin repeat-containing domain protein [Baffinella frigidus]|nr:ankyrin repeat-containing domain protein [Cryptophyta sp. CCMP2293]